MAADHVSQLIHEPAQNPLSGVGFCGVRSRSVSEGMRMSVDAPAISWTDGRSGRSSRQPLAIGSVVVGRRADAGLFLLDEHVSEHHAELYWDGDRLRVRDLGSRNGTAVNGQPISDWTDLSQGDVIGFGRVEAVVELAPTASPSASLAPQRVAPLAAPPPVATPLSQQPIFISHASEDKRQVRDIAGELRRRGWTVWIDDAEIPGGEEWSASLLRALESSWIVLLVVSHASMTSKWVRREVAAADRLGRRIIPVVIESVPYPDDLRIRLAGVQQIDATDLHDSERRQGQLSRIDDALISAARTRQPGKPGAARIAIGMTIMVIGLIGLAGGFAAFMYLGFQSTGAPGDDTPSPFIGWGVFAASMIVAAIGTGIHRSGKRKGI